jgi:hypothetical protein
MEEMLAFLWLNKFTRMDLGGKNGGTRLRVNNMSPFSSFDFESEPTSDLEAFTSATNDFYY